MKGIGNFTTHGMTRRCNLCVRHGIRDGEGGVLVVRNTSVLVLKSHSLSSDIIPNEPAAFFRLVASLSKADVVQVGLKSAVRAGFWWRANMDCQGFHLKDVL